MNRNILPSFLLFLIASFSSYASNMEIFNINLIKQDNDLVINVYNHLGKSLEIEQIFEKAIAEKVGLFYNDNEVQNESHHGGKICRPANKEDMLKALREGREFKIEMQISNAPSYYIYRGFFRGSNVLKLGMDTEQWFDYLREFINSKNMAGTSV